MRSIDIVAAKDGTHSRPAELPDFFPFPTIRLGRSRRRLWATALFFFDSNPDVLA
jgi:hypothetical protein